jgi:glycosyltransferase involved in cell wall biosynthesis
VSSVAAPIPVSICLTTYNRGSILPASIDSLLAQSFGDFELIISDDCSPDDTEAICRAYAARDPRVRYFRNATNLRMPGNLNAAIARTRGDYIANVHDGDVFRPDLIEKWKTALDELPTAAFVFNQYQGFDAHGNPRIDRAPLEQRRDPREVALHFFRTFTSCVWGTVMTRREAYAAAGQFNPDYGFISDVDMWLRLARDHDVAYVAEPLITITPREPHHPYAFVHWRVWLWTLSIYVAHLEHYRDRIPAEVERFRLSYPRRRRELLLRDLAICVRHRRWDRLREALAIWRDDADPLLRGLGRAFGSPGHVPEWHSASAWHRTSLG